MVICLELGADLHMSQLMPLPLTVSCFSKIQIGFTFLVPAHLGSPRKRAVKRVCAKLELVDKFCYLGDTLSVDGDADACVEARIRIGWNKFRQLVPLLTNKDVSLITS